MATPSFAKAILAGTPIDLYNHGKMKRDFTYVEDVAEGIVRTLDVIPEPDPAWDAEHPDAATSSAPYRIYNIGNSDPVELDRFVEVLEACLGVTAIKQYLPMQPGDVPATFADTSALEAATGFRPRTSIEDGLTKFAAWYRDYYNP
jgi:UDP-glucuronate 4-epimerase